MKITIKFIDNFGRLCADGTKAFKFYQEKIKPEIDQSHDVIFDFEEVKNMNSSFANAIFSNMVKDYGADILMKISFINCRDHLKMIISAALDFGLKKIDSN